MEYKAALGSVATDLVFERCTPGFALEFLTALVTAFPHAVDVGNVNDDIDVVAADFVTNHVGCGTVGGDVDFGEYVEEIGLFKAACAAEVGEHGF